MPTPSFALLCDSWIWDDGSASVRLKLLPSEHPFTKLLLRKLPESRNLKMHDYPAELWRSYTKSWQNWSSSDSDDHRDEPTGDLSGLRGGIYSREAWGYRRGQVVWSSPFGPSHEGQLLLYDCIKIWLKGQELMSLGAYDRPCNLVGAIRIDDGEDSGFERNIRSRYRSCYSIIDKKVILVDGLDEREADACTIHQELAEADEQITTEQACTIHQELAEADEQVTTEQESCWDLQQVILLENIVLSCSQLEVQRCLDIYLQAQAHQQFSRFKDELLEHVQIFRLSGHSL